MQRVDAQQAELRELNEINFSQLDARIDGPAAALPKTDADLRREMEAGFARREIRIEQRTADIMERSSVFWVESVLTLVGALATLPRLLP